MPESDRTSAHPGAGLSVEENWTERLRALARQSTPARVFENPPSPCYSTRSHLQLRADHSAARDAVLLEFDLRRDLGDELVSSYGLFEISTLVQSRDQYIKRPDLGRKLAPETKMELQRRCPSSAEIQVVIGDGLSAAAVRAQVPALLPRLLDEADSLGWTLGQPFAIRYCRVGVMNDIGECLRPELLVLLIGERPGLRCAESLSAYLAFRPRPGHDDSNRNLISNIHERGIPVESAASRILSLAARIRQQQESGVAIKEAGGWRLAPPKSELERKDARTQGRNRLN